MQIPQITIDSDSDETDNEFSIGKFTRDCKKQFTKGLVHGGIKSNFKRKI